MSCSVHQIEVDCRKWIHHKIVWPCFPTNKNWQNILQFFVYFCKCFQTNFRDRLPPKILNGNGPQGKEIDPLQRTNLICECP